MGKKAGVPKAPPQTPAAATSPATAQPPVAAPAGQLDGAASADAQPTAPVADPSADQQEQSANLGEPEPKPEQPAAPVATPRPAVSKVPELDDYIARHEQASQDLGLVVTAISHPDAKPRLHPGVYAGFPIDAGELSATYSDGSKH